MEAQSRKQLRRCCLRAANGMGIGVLAGGGLGFLLRGLSTLGVGLATGEGLDCHYVRYWPFCAFNGLFPGIGGGALIGAMFIIREAGRRSRLAAVAGVGIGLGWALLHRGYQPPPVLIAMSVSGLLGGLLMAGFLTWVRRRWTWWTRWEINN